MTWDYWICLYIQTHCAARGLRSTTIAAYASSLRQFRNWIAERYGTIEPNAVSSRQVLEYVTYLRRERDNGDSAVNRAVTILKNFYRAMVAMGHLELDQNPLAHFPKLKQAPRKLPVVLADTEVTDLLDAPPSDIVLGLRDRAILTTLYGTGIRASECAGLTERNVDLSESTIRVTGKGGRQRVIPLNRDVAETLRVYRAARGPLAPDSPFFRSRTGQAMSRGAIYERVRKYARQARIGKRVSPHTLRHTFASHLVRVEKNLVTIRDLLGHRQISSTQIYLHITAEALRGAIDRHPVARLAPSAATLAPDVRLPFQHPPPFRNTG